MLSKSSLLRRQDSLSQSKDISSQDVQLSQMAAYEEAAQRPDEDNSPLQPLVLSSAGSSSSDRNGLSRLGSHASASLSSGLVQSSVPSLQQRFIELQAENQSMAKLLKSQERQCSELKEERDTLVADCDKLVEDLKIKDETIRDLQAQLKGKEQAFNKQEKNVAKPQASQSDESASGSSGPELRSSKKSGLFLSLEASQLSHFEFPKKLSKTRGRPSIAKTSFESQSYYGNDPFDLTPFPAGPVPPTILPPGLKRNHSALNLVVSQDTSPPIPGIVEGEKKGAQSIAKKPSASGVKQKPKSVTRAAKKHKS